MMLSRASLLRLHLRSASLPPSSVSEINLAERLVSEMKSISMESIYEDYFLGRDMLWELSDAEKKKLHLVRNAYEWRDTIRRVLPAVVVLRVTACRAFDTELPTSFEAMGFVVDKQLGIILTTRRVVQPGPVVARAIFLNHEEIPVHPIYRDPEHDFGFFRYDPRAIQSLNYEEITLAPEDICVYLEIRAIHKNSCGKVLILEAGIAALNCHPPKNREYGYNDFNIFYIQSTSENQGGVSGSPVFDLLGRAVALNVGGNLSRSSAYYLPLDRVKRALKLLQKGRNTCVNGWESVCIPRGTLQVTFRHRGGMLVVDSVVPGGPCDNHLQLGDVLVNLDDKITTHFLALEEMLDNSVDKNITLRIERHGVSMTKSIKVQDLHSITPDHFLEVSGAVLHPLSYQQARNFNFQCGLVYVADPGYMLFRAGVPRHAIIKEFNDQEISKLEDIISVLSKLSKGDRVPIEYITYKSRNRREFSRVTLDHQDWYDTPKMYTRDDNSGLWTVELAIEPEPLPLQSCIGDIELSSLSILSPSMEPIHEASSYEVSNGVSIMEDIDATNASFGVRIIESALVKLEVSVPKSFSLDGVRSLHSSGTGVIVHHSKHMGLVAVDRNTVEISACDVVLSFAAFPADIPGQVVFLHPVYNYALVAYNPSTLGAQGASLVRAAKLLPEPSLCNEDAVYLVELSERLRAVFTKSTVKSSRATLKVGSSDWPQYRATNMEAIVLDEDYRKRFTGVLCDEHGKVRALWGIFGKEYDQTARGIPIYLVSQLLEQIISGGKGQSLLINCVKRPMPLVRISERGISLSKAQSIGLREDWIQVLADRGPMRKQILRVKACLAGSNAQSMLKRGDMLLAINKKPVTCFRDIEDACHKLEKDYDNDGKLNIIIFREGRELEIAVGTNIRSGSGTTHAVNWCGCTVQEPHSAMRALGFLPKEGQGHGVCVFNFSRGSPAHTYGLRRGQWIVEVNGKKTPNLDSFINVTKEFRSEDHVQIKTIKLYGKKRVLTLRPDLHYWPTWELRLDPETAIWRRVTV